MFHMLPSLLPFVEQFRDVFTAPSFNTHQLILLGWTLCLGNHSLLRVFLASSPSQLHDFSARHGKDAFYNFFERSAWTPADLFRRLVLFVLTNLSFAGVIKIVVDDTLFHKRGLHVFGKGWFRDAVASTKKRVATASGHNWVVLAIVYEVPGLSVVLALPVMARLHLSGEGELSCAQLAKLLVQELLRCCPDKSFLLVGDGGYSNSELLEGLDELGDRLHYIGRLRCDAALYDPEVAPRVGKGGPKPKKGPRLPSPKEIAKQAKKAGQEGKYHWQVVSVEIYGEVKQVLVCAFRALWPSVLGSRTVQVLILRDPDGKRDDCYLLATNLAMSVENIIRNYSLRWSIEMCRPDCPSRGSLYFCGRVA
jgi:hypothetical protein